MQRHPIGLAAGVVAMISMAQASESTTSTTQAPVGDPGVAATPTAAAAKPDSIFDRIWSDVIVSDAPGGGSVFAFELPRADREQTT